MDYINFVKFTICKGFFEHGPRMGEHSQKEGFISSDVTFRNSSFFHDYNYHLIKKIYLGPQESLLTVKKSHLPVVVVISNEQCWSSIRIRSKESMTARHIRRNKKFVKLILWRITMAIFGIFCPKKYLSQISILSAN